MKRPAISSCHPKIDGYPVGQHPMVVQLLKGMLNMRPPKPRYTHTWDVHLVTKYLDSLGKTKLLTLNYINKRSEKYMSPNPLPSSHSVKKMLEDHGTMCLYRGTMILCHL